MKQSRVLARAVILLAFLLSGLVSGVGGQYAAAQTGTQTYTSQLTGGVVTTTGAWTIDTESSGASDGTEVIIAQGQFDGVMIAFMPSGLDLVMARDYLLNEFSSYFDTIVPIDRGAYGNVSYSLDMASAEGVEFGMFSLFLGERASGYVEYYLYFGPAMFFEQGFGSAQQNVTVGGKKIFDGVDGGGLQTLLTANAGVTGAASNLPEDNVLDGGNGAGTQALPTAVPPTAVPPVVVPPTQAPQAGGTTADGGTYVAIVQAEMDFLQTTLDDFIINFAALQGDSVDTAISEINRVATEWIGYPERAAGIVAPSGFENVDAAYQTLASDVEELGNTWFLVVDAIQSGDDTAIQPAIDTFIAKMNDVQEQIDAINTLLDQGGGTSATGTSPQEVHPTPEPTEEMADLTGGSSKGSTRPNISIPGKADQNESETGLANQSEPPSQTDQTVPVTDPADYADLGLVSDNEYVSPQFDVGITWDEGWYFDADYSDPITSDTESGVDSVTLTWSDGPVSIFVTVTTADGVQPTDLADYWVTDEYLADTSSPDADVLLHESNRFGSASVLLRDYLDDGTEISLLRSATCADAQCDTLSIVTMIGLPDVFPDSYADARGGIDIDGNRLFDVFTPRDVSTALDD